VYQTIVALRINRYTRSSSRFQKRWWPQLYPIRCWKNWLFFVSSC